MCWSHFYSRLDYGPPQLQGRYKANALNYRSDALNIEIDVLRTKFDGVQKQIEGIQDWVDAMEKKFDKFAIESLKIVQAKK